MGQSEVTEGGLELGRGERGCPRLLSPSPSARMVVLVEVGGCDTCMQQKHTPTEIKRATK